jgi:hypothetical protein
MPFVSFQLLSPSAIALTWKLQAFVQTVFMWSADIGIWVLYISKVTHQCGAKLGLQWMKKGCSEQHIKSTKLVITSRHFSIAVWFMRRTHSELMHYCYWVQFITRSVFTRMLLMVFIPTSCTPLLTGSFSQMSLLLPALDKSVHHDGKHGQFSL